MIPRKRMLALALAVLMIAGLVGCTRDDGKVTSSSTPPPASSLPPEPESDTSTSLPDDSDVSDPSLSMGALAPSGDSASSDDTRMAAATPTFEPAEVPGDRMEWGQGVQFNDQNQPIASVNSQKLYGKYDACFIGPGDEKVIYLTFDQGYENGFTTPILDTLLEKDVKATFFLVKDYLTRNDDLVRRMIDEGHVLGNHSYGHKDPTTLSIEDATGEITKLHELVRETYGIEMNLYRPPAGVYSERTLAIAQNHGYHTIFWSFAYKDWEADNQPDPGTAIERLCTRAHNGAIYLLHSVSRTNAEILGTFIDRMRAEGYTFGLLQNGNRENLHGPMDR